MGVEDVRRSGVGLPRGLSSLLSAHSLEVLDERNLLRISFTGIFFFSNIKCKIRASGGKGSIFFFFLFFSVCVHVCACVHVLGNGTSRAQVWWAGGLLWSHT